MSCAPNVTSTPAAATSFLPDGRKCAMLPRLALLHRVTWHKRSRTIRRNCRNLRFVAQNTSVPPGATLASAAVVRGTVTCGCRRATLGKNTILCFSFEIGLCATRSCASELTCSCTNRSSRHTSAQPGVQFTHMEPLGSTTARAEAPYSHAGNLGLHDDDEPSPKSAGRQPRQRPSTRGRSVRRDAMNKFRAASPDGSDDDSGGDGSGGDADDGMQKGEGDPTAKAAAAARRRALRRGQSFDSARSGASGRTSVSGFSEDGASWGNDAAAPRPSGSPAAGAPEAIVPPALVRPQRSYSAGSAADSLDNSHGFGEGLGDGPASQSPRCVCATVVYGFRASCMIRLLGLAHVLCLFRAWSCVIPGMTP